MTAVNAKVNYARRDGFPAFDQAQTIEMINDFLKEMATYSLVKLMLRAHWKDHSLHLATETHEGKKLDEVFLPELTKKVGILVSKYQLSDMRITIPPEEKLNHLLN